MSSDDEFKTKILNPTMLADLRTWDLPEIEPDCHIESPSDSTKPIEKFTLTQAEIDHLKSEAEQAGFKKGYEDGFETGLDAVQQQVKMLKATICRLQHPIDSVDAEMEQAILKLIIEMVQQITKVELQLDPTKVLTVVTEALNALPYHNRQVQMTCHPDDLLIIEQYLSSQDFSDLNCTVVADHDVMPGGCSIHSVSTTVDASLPQRIQEVIKRVLGVKLTEMSSVFTHRQTEDDVCP